MKFKIKLIIDNGEHVEIDLPQNHFSGGICLTELPEGEPIPTPVLKNRKKILLKRDR